MPKLPVPQGLRKPGKPGERRNGSRRNGAPNDVVATLSALPRTDFASREELIALYPRLGMGAS